MQWTRVRRLVVALAAVGLGVALTAWETEAAAMRTVHDSKNQIAITVPATWRVQSPNGSATLTATAPVSGTALPDSVNVVVHDAPIGMNTPQACENEAAWVTQHFAHITPTTVAKTPMTVGGKPAYAWTYTWTASTGEQPVEPAGVRPATGHGLRRDGDDGQYAGGSHVSRVGTHANHCLAADRRAADAADDRPVVVRAVSPPAPGTSGHDEDHARKECPRQPVRALGSRRAAPEHAGAILWRSTRRTHACHAGDRERRMTSDITKATTSCPTTSSPLPRSRITKR